MRSVIVALVLILSVFSVNLMGQEHKLTVTGKLVRAMAIGGESTGWVIEFAAPETVGDKQIDSIQISYKDTGKLGILADNNVTASGVISHRQEVESGDILILEISSIKQWPASPDSSGQQEQKKSVFQKLKENAEYQQQQQQKQAADTSNSNAKADDSSQSKEADRAKYLETHACITTDGADKANELTDECNKVTSAPHRGCNTQENTCDEIRKNTQKGCWGLAASAPDFCFTKYK